MNNKKLNKYNNNCYNSQRAFKTCIQMIFSSLNCVVDALCILYRFNKYFYLILLLALIALYFCVNFYLFAIIHVSSFTFNSTKRAQRCLFYELNLDNYYSSLNGHRH